MTDVSVPNPPESVDERSEALGRLALLRDTFLARYERVTSGEVGLRPADPARLSLLGSMRHMAEMERAYGSWPLGDDPKFQWVWSPDEDGAGDDPEATEDDADLAYSTWMDERSKTDLALAGSPDLGATSPLTGRSIRWNLAQLVDEYARHGPAGDNREVIGEDEPDRPAWLVPVVSAVVALLAGLLVGWLLWSAAEEPTEDEAGLTAQVEELTAQNTELQDQVDDLTAQLADLEAGGEGAVAELTAENEQLSADLEARDMEVERLTGENETLTDQISSLEEQNTQLQSRIDEILDDFDSALVPAPDLVGATADFAAAQAEDNGWVLVQIPSATDDVAPGTVLSQSPPPGTPMLSGSALAVSVAATPEPAPEPGPGVETVSETSGTGPATSDAVDLEAGTRHALVYSFTGDGRHTVSVVDGDGTAVARLVDVNGTKEGATALPLAGSYRLQVDVEDDVDWTVQVIALP